MKFNCITMAKYFVRTVEKSVVGFRSFKCMILAACFVLFLNNGLVLSQDKKEIAADKSKTTMVVDSDNTNGDKLSVEEKLVLETAALEFAELHHPELAKLLKNLKKHEPNQYNKGIMEIRRTIVRLEKVRDKSPEKYDREVQVWKVNSQIRLQVGRILLSDKREDHVKLTELLSKKRQLEIQYLQAELDRITLESLKIEERMTRVQNEIKAKEADVSGWIDQEKERLLKSGKSNFKAEEKSQFKNKSTAKPSAENSLEP